MDLIKPTPINMMISPVYKNIYPANIWNKKDQEQQTQCVEVQDASPQTTRPMTKQDHCIVVSIVLFALCLFIYGWYRLDHDD